MTKLPTLAGVPFEATLSRAATAHSNSEWIIRGRAQSLGGHSWLELSSERL